MNHLSESKVSGLGVGSLSLLGVVGLGAANAGLGVRAGQDRGRWHSALSIVKRSARSVEAGRSSREGVHGVALHVRKLEGGVVDGEVGSVGGHCDCFKLFG